MKTRVKLIIPNDPLADDDDFNFMEIQISFWDEASTPRRTALVTVHVEKQDISLDELKKLATDKAREFLKEAIGD